MQNQDLRYSANCEMKRVREENEKLKLLLTGLVKDYHSLQTDFFDILQQDYSKPEDQATSKPTVGASAHSRGQNEDENELVSLSLGLKMKDNSNQDIEKKNNCNSSEGNNDENLDEGGLELGLGITSVEPSVSAQAPNVPASTESKSFEEEAGKEVEEPTEIRPPSKVLQTVRSTGENNGEAASQQSQMKKARVSIRARCDTQMMNDGCQWRKYGQKIAKGNPCPRAYYRCTVSSSCPVKKQVQRCAEDMSILITTYEGTHNHPLPISATAMASTTSAAASILQSPSLTSQPLLRNPETSPIFYLSSSDNHNALNSSNYQIPRPPYQFHFLNPSISTSNSHPTITLDLTSSTFPNTSYIGRFTSGFASMPRYNSTTSINFSPSSTFSPLQSSIPQSPYCGGGSSTYGGFNNNGTLGHDKIQSGTILNTGTQPLPGTFHQPNFMSKHATSQQVKPTAPIYQQPFPESLAAATRAIAANPKFQSALAAALTTYVGNEAAGGSGSNGKRSASTRHMNVPSSSSVGDQQGSLALFPAPLPSAASKSVSGSPPDKGK